MSKLFNVLYINKKQKHSLIDLTNFGYFYR